MAALRPPFKANSHLSLAMKIKAGKYDRIPAKYSEELWEAVQWMVTLCQDQRASIDELMALPRIRQVLKPTAPPDAEKLRQRLILKEQSLQQREADLQQREERVKQREDSVLMKDKDFQKCRTELGEKERLLNEILKMYELPQTTCDLQKYLESCSTGPGSGNLGSTGVKSKLSFSPQTIQPRAPRLPNTQQSSQTTSQVQHILKNNRSDPNLNKDVRQILDEQGSPIEYLKRFKIAKRDEQDSLLQESSLADTFRQTVFNPDQAKEQSLLSTFKSEQKTFDSRPNSSRHRVNSIALPPKQP